jgi:hypothetical protein
MNKIITQYIRKPVTSVTRKGTIITRNNRIGQLTATKVKGQIVIGYSLVNTSAGDRFDKSIARQRVLETLNSPKALLKSDTVPHTVRKALPVFIDRCNKYFKD